MILNAQALFERLQFVFQGQQKKGAYPECHQNAIIDVEETETGEVLVLRSFSGVSHFRAVLGRPDNKTVIGSTKRDKDGAAGPFVFDTRKVISVLKKSKSSVKLTIDFDKKIIVFNLDGTRIKEVGMDANGFADFPDMDAAPAIQVPETMAKALRRAAWAVDKKVTQTNLQGVMIRPVYEDDNERIEICGTDRTVISVVSDKDNIGCVSEPGIIPVEAVSVLADALTRGAAPTFFMDSNRVSVSAGDFYVSAILIGEEMVAFWNVMNTIKESKMRVARMDRERLSDAIDIASTYQDDYGSILLMFRGTKLKVLGFNHATGRRADSLVDFESSGESLEGANFVVASNRVTAILKNIEADHFDFLFPVGSAATLLASPVENGSAPTEVLLSLMTMQDHYLSIIEKQNAPQQELPI